MKKIIVSLGVVLFALIFVLISCDTKKPEGATSSLASIPAKEAPAPVTPRPEIPAFISGSELAFKSYLSDPKATIGQVKAMYAATQTERRILASYSDPLSGNTGVKSPRPMNVLSEDICRCPGTTTGVCPCVGDTTLLYIAVSDASVKAYYGTKELIEKKTTGKVDGQFKAFKWPATLAAGPDTLTFVGKFGGKEVRKYRVPVEFSGGRLYLKWPQ